ncbi:MAG: MscL family protein [Candidatus Nomurabacteria bacterium]|nr:MscL family protein [Candidatus Nomurabacteria bacterium]
MKRLKDLQKIKGLSGFKEFLKEQGVVTLAIGFILGSSIIKLVSSLVVDIINPLLNSALGGVEDLNTKVAHIGTANIHYGTFISNGIDFIVIALVVYVGVRLLGLDREEIGKMDIGKINALSAAGRK